MALLDLTGLTMNAEEAKDVSAAIHEAVITGGEIAKYHDIVTGIEHKTQIPFIGNLGLVGKKMTTCDRAENPSTIPLSEKFWDLEHIGDRLKHCSHDVPTLLKLFKKAQKMNPDFYDRIDGEEFGMIIAKVEQAMVVMLNRLVWFGDKAADTIANGGELKNGTDPDYFNIINGLFQQLFIDIPDTAENYVAIPENALASYALQANLSADRGLATFRAMYNKMDARYFEALQNGAQPEFLVTRQLAQNWEDFLEDKALATTLLTRAEDGSSRMSYRGIPIVVRYDWDSNIRNYFDNGTVYVKPHRAVLTLKENIPVGTLSESDLDTLTSFYDQKDKANYIDFDLKLDTKHLQDYMTVFAY